MRKNTECVQCVIHEYIYTCTISNKYLELLKFLGCDDNSFISPQSDIEYQQPEYEEEEGYIEQGLAFFDHGIVSTLLLLFLVYFFDL